MSESHEECAGEFVSQKKYIYIYNYLISYDIICDFSYITIQSLFL